LDSPRPDSGQASTFPHIVYSAPLHGDHIRSGIVLGLPLGSPESVATPLWGKCKVSTHTPKNGTWKSSGTPKNSKFDCTGHNTSPWTILHTVGKLLKYRCPKWPRMSHLDICSTSYGRKKGRESNWQFDSRPLKVGNRPDLGVCRWSATHHWKAIKDNYKFSLVLIPIEGLSKKLWMPKVSRVETGTISGLPLGSPKTKSHLDVALVEWRRVYYMGDGGGFPQVRAVVNQVSLELPVACPSTKGALKCELTNWLVGWFDVGSSEWIVCPSS
jgi:hypothetical protein